MKKAAKEKNSVKKGFDFSTIKTIEDVYKLADEVACKDYDQAMSGYTTPYRTAHNQVLLMSNAAWSVECKTADGHDTDQKKWWPWCIVAPVFRFDGSLFIYGSSVSGAGSRLSFPLEEMSDFFGNLLIDIYKDLQN